MDVSPRPNTVTLSQFEFCLNYLANGFNASAAYRSAHPGVTNGTSRVEGHRTLTNPNVTAFLAQQMGDRWKARQMDGQEALARIASAVTLDIRVFFDDKGKLLPPKDWPEEAAQLVESFEIDKGKIRVLSRAIALRTILEQTGKLKTLPDSIDALAEAIKADLLAHGHAQEQS